MEIIGDLAARSRNLARGKIQRLLALPWQAALRPLFQDLDSGPLCDAIEAVKLSSPISERRYRSRQTQGARLKIWRIEKLASPMSDLGRCCR